MHRMSARLFVACAVILAAAGGWLGWRNVAARRAWAAIKPPLPAAVGADAPGLDLRLRALAVRLDTWPPDRAALAEFARVCQANGQLAAATSAYEALMTLEPTEPRWPHLLGLIVAGYGVLDQALPLLQRTTQLAPGYVPAWLRLGDAYLKSNIIPEAEAAYQHVLAQEPGNRYALLGLGRCDLQSGRLTAARARLQRAAAGQGDSIGAESLLAMVYERLGNTDASAAARSRVQRSGHYTQAPDPWADELIFECHNPYTLLTAASAAVVDENLGRALTLLKRGLELAPNDARLHRQLGKVLTIRGDYAGGRRELERAVALEPANDAIRSDLLALLRKLGAADAIAKIVSDGLAATPGSAALQFEAGKLAASAGRLDEAINHFEISWRVGKDQPGPGVELADAYFRAGRDRDAFATLEEVLVRFPKEQPALLMAIRHGAQNGDPRTPAWLQQAADGGAPETLLAGLRDQYHHHEGALP